MIIFSSIYDSSIIFFGAYYLNLIDFFIILHVILKVEGYQDLEIGLLSRQEHLLVSILLSRKPLFETYMHIFDFIVHSGAKKVTGERTQLRGSLDDIVSCSLKKLV